jgi:hypothetical protein
MQNDARRKRANAYEWVMRLRDSARGRSDLYARTDLTREHPQLTEQLQRDIELRLEVAQSAARSNAEDAWRRIGEALDVLLRSM